MVSRGDLTAAATEALPTPFDHPRYVRQATSLARAPNRRVRTAAGEPDANQLRDRPGEAPDPYPLHRVRDPGRVLEHFTVLVGDPERPERLDVLLDLSETTSLPGRIELRAVTTEIARIRPFVSLGRLAIVASRDALFGMARMFQAFAER